MEKGATSQGMQVASNNFDEIKNGNKPVLLDFYATWCGPCQIVSPIIDEIAVDREDITVGKINVDVSPDLAQEFGIYSIPTLVVLKEGKVYRQVSGARPTEAILALLD